MEWNINFWAPNCRVDTYQDQKLEPRSDDVLLRAKVRDMRRRPLV